METTGSACNKLSWGPVALSHLNVYHNVGLVAGMGRREFGWGGVGQVDGFCSCALGGVRPGLVLAHTDPGQEGGLAQPGQQQQDWSGELWYLCPHHAPHWPPQCCRVQAVLQRGRARRGPVVQRPAVVRLPRLTGYQCSAEQRQKTRPR